MSEPMWDAYQWALSQFPEETEGMPTGRPFPSGYCIEMVALMYRWLKEHGYQPVVNRRNMGPSDDDYNGHWTIELDGVEFDPTYTAWEGEPDLYEVTPESPHHQWPVTERDTPEQNQAMMDLSHSLKWDR